MQSVRNAQVAVRLSSVTVRKQLRLLCRLTGTSDLSVGVLLTGNNTIRKMNRQYRNVDRPTDILAFPYMTFDAPQMPPKLLQREWDDNDMRELGDIVISVRYVRDEIESELPHGPVDASVDEDKERMIHSVRSHWGDVAACLILVADG